MAIDCTLETEQLKQALINQRKAAGRKDIDDRELDKFIESNVQTIIRRGDELGSIKAAVDELAPVENTNTGISAIKQDRIVQDVHETIKQADDPKINAFKAVAAHIVSIEDQFARLGSGSRMSLESLKDTYHTRIVNPLIEMLDEEGKTLFGGRNVANMIRENEDDFVAGLFGDGTTDAGKYGVRIRDMIDEANSIHPNVQFNFTPKMNTFSLQKFRAKHGDENARLFFARNIENGGRVWDQIVEDNMVHLSSNAIKINNAESWYAVHKAFSDVDALGSINESFNDMSRLLAIYDSWGNNPIGTLNEILDHSDLKFSTQEKSILRAYMNNSLVGDYIPPANTFWARFLKGGRSMTGSAFLGLSAVLTGADRVTAPFHLHAIGARSAPGTSKATFTRIAPNEKQRRIARMYGVGLFDYQSQIFSGFGLGKGRFNPIGEGEGRWVYNSVMKMNQALMRVYGISMLTRGNKQLYASHLGQSLGYAIETQQWGDLHPNFAKALGQYGIDEISFNKLKTMDDIIVDGAVDPLMIKDNHIWKQVIGFIRGNADRGVIEPNVIDEMAISAFRLDPSDPAFETVKTISQFQSFPITYQRKLINGIIKANKDDKMRMALMMGELAGTTMLAGYLIHNLRQGLLGFGEVVSSGGETSFEDVWEDMISIPGRSDEETVDSVLKTLYYGQPGGIVVEWILELLGHEKILGKNLGVSTYQGDKFNDVIGPFFNTTFQAVSKFIYNIFTEDPDEALANFGYDISKLGPGNRFPGVEYLYREAIRRPLKEMFR